ncbi:hypothetical protein AVEN_214155-1 [Araneus ventricosus]|uniref:Uncharacterized protein n=1 Tax=Araneus ventricosus TaxID=182803 RepID=A0A4Y2WNX4_ARAVE|nr:hypothetical protein AVEN_214155-1 [Araneus ventricosus]
MPPFRTETEDPGEGRDRVPIFSWELTRRLSYAICPKACFFLTHSSRNIRHVIHGGSKVRYRRSSIPLLHTADFRFSSLEPGSQSRQKCSLIYLFKEKHTTEKTPLTDCYKQQAHKEQKPQRVNKKMS